MGPGRQHGQADRQRDRRRHPHPAQKGDAKAASPPSLAGTLVLTEKTGDGEQRQAFDVVAKLDPAFVPSAAPLGCRAAARALARARRCCSRCWAA